MPANNRKAIVIGETSLCTKCIEYLIESGWKVILVISDDQVVSAWAQGRSLPVEPTAQLNNIHETGFYLFSIINPVLIPKAFLTGHNIPLALNYHDSLLPQYAGINSTTWAIINHEKAHGVTLHQITPDIDDGDIVAQAVIDLEQDETATSLNLKCSERFLLLFQEVITKIAAGTLAFSKQDLANRSYYGAKTLPTNYAVINGIEDLETLYYLARGLTFDVGYDNQVATVKVVLDGKFYIAENFNAALLRNNHVPDNQTILFNTVKDIYGNPTDLKIRYQDIAQPYPLTSEELQCLSDLKVQERKNRRNILEFLKQVDVTTGVLADVFGSSDCKECVRKIELPTTIRTSTALVTIYLVLARIFYLNKFVVGLYTADSSEISSRLHGLIENRGFICISDEILSKGFAYLENYLTQAQANCCTLVKDFSYRYGLRLSTEIAITLGKVECTDQHKLIINLADDKITIRGGVVHQSQIDVIARSVAALLSEEIQKEIATKDLRQIGIIDHAQYQQIVYEWNKTDHDYPKDKTVHALFEEQVRKTPDNIAVVYEDTKLTYQELNDRANQLANHLRKNHGIEPDDLVALCLDRSEQMLIAILGVLKAGGAYVPIDPSYPDERVGYILGDAELKAVLTNDKYAGRLQQLIAANNKDITVMAGDKLEMQKELARQKTTNPITATTSSNLVYVIYTSGTTGDPKGTLIEHRSVVNYVTYLIDYDQLNSTSIGSQYAAFSFDAAVIEIYPILLSGGSLCMVPDKDRLDSIKTDNFFNKNKVTYAFLPTKFAELFFDLKSSSLINLIVGGEKLEKFIKQPYRITNAYGPTEATVQSTSFIVDKLYSNIPIGKPINNVKCYVVDGCLNLLPIGAVGELVIGGENLARGYLGFPRLNAEKFVANPFQTAKEKAQHKNSRLYKTGDLVRLLPDGNLEFIGRNDFQIKLRGYRIELGEIGAKLVTYPGVKQAAGVVKERTNDDKDKYLVAYYVADKKLDEVKMLGHLAAYLPEYMLPIALVHLDKLPLTINGKLDQNALPVPEFENNAGCIAPDNEQEQLICEAFAKVLGAGKIGIDHDFFTFGGNSIQAIQLVAMLQSNFDVKVADIFNLRTPRRLAKNLYFGKNVLKEKLKQVKLLYKNKPDKKNSLIDATLQKKIDLYLEDSSNLRIDYSLLKPITNILLTGATGYLGCNILNQLLKSTDYNIYVLVRADSHEEAIDRINKKFQFYFARTLDDMRNSAVFVIPADLEKSDLGLSSKEYQTLATKIDSIIHAAALVKHYGEYDKFYSANVQATINLLDFAKLTDLKDFHYISTSSVLNFGFIPNCTEYSYTEDDLPDNLKPWNNVYVQTKLLGEREVIKYRDYKVNTNIYRVGNLAFMAENYCTQENVEDNAFFNWLTCLFKMKYTAHGLNLVEISQVDLTAQAIMKLFDKKQLANGTYHVFNPYLFNISKIFTDDRTSPVTTLTMAQFIDNITRNLNNNIYRDLIVKFLLHQGWLDERGIQNTTSIKVLQNRTQHILEQLHFKWPAITNEVFSKYLEHLKLYGVKK